MVKKRLIACLICRNGMIVQSIGFKHNNVIGNVITAVDFFNVWAIDEIVILDVSRDTEYRKKFYDIIKDLSKRCFVPLTVGGWVKSNDDIRKLLQIGADKVVINTEAFRKPEFITEASKTFGSQCIVVSIDAKRNKMGHEVFIDRGKEPTGITAVEWSRKAKELGAGEIFLTSIDNDGMRNGYDLELIRSVSETVDIPVIASGGVGEWEHIVEGIREGKAQAASVANRLHYTEHSTKEAKDYMIKAGIDARKPVFYRISTPRKPKYEWVTGH